MTESKICSLNYRVVIFALIVITCLCVNLISKNLFDVRQVEIPTVENTISRKKSAENPYKLSYNTKNELMRIFRDAGQLQHALMNLLASANALSENDVESIIKKLKKYQLPLTNDIFNTIQEIIKNDNEDLKKLQQLVLDRLIRLQNPTDCSKARKFVCYINWNCGLGCISHHLSECFLIALGTNRTLLADFSQIKYRGMEKVFKPLSGCVSVDIDINKLTEWKGEKSNKPTAYHLPIVKRTIYGPTAVVATKFVPFAMPPVVADEIIRVHNDPNAWWIGQLVSYCLRLQPWVLEAIDKGKKEIGFRHPIVGIQVRKTDKKSEAPYQALSKYMHYVNNWYERYEIGRNTSEKTDRKVYLATDDYEVVEEAKTSFANFTFLHDPLIKQHATMNNRYTEEGLLAVVRDVTILSQCDFFVGTFSSNIGRLIYELMQSKSERTFDMMSADVMYNNHKGHPQWHKAISEYYPQGGDIELKVGDKILVNSRRAMHHEGFGKNQRTGESGSYPMIKVKYFVQKENFTGFG